MPLFDPLLTDAPLNACNSKWRRARRAITPPWSFLGRHAGKCGAPKATRNELLAILSIVQTSRSLVAMCPLNDCVTASCRLGNMALTEVDRARHKDMLASCNSAGASAGFWLPELSSGPPCVRFAA
eukprot:3017269-Pleurochrysis_carterae.AAC.1